MQFSHIKNIIRPRLIFGPYAVAKVVLVFCQLISFVIRFVTPPKASRKLAMEAGEGGWNLIEFKELYQSACEFLSAQQIEKIVIDREQSYLRQVINNDTVKACTH